MTWSVQIHPWTIPSLLAFLLLLREGGYLWSRRREPGAAGILPLVAIAAAWCFLHLALLSTGSLAAKIRLDRIQYLPAAAVPLAWAWFAFGQAHRRRDLLAWWVAPAVAASAVLMILAVYPGAAPVPGQDGMLVERGGVVGLQIERGGWHWLHLTLRVWIVGVATFVLARRILRRTGYGIQLVVALAAAALCVGATAFEVVSGPGRVWTDLAPAAFGIAATMLGRGIVRRGLLGLGPVARTLVLEELRDPVVVLDGRGRIVDLNRAAERILGLERYGNVPVDLGTLWASSRSGHAEPTRVRLKRDAGAADVDDEEVEERTFEVTSTRLGGRSGTGRSAFVFRDVTARDRMERDLREAHDALARANVALERLANTDPLTGLANRRHFMDTLAREIERADRYGRPLAVVLLDLDHFKRVNDDHGHAAGDQVLRDAAEVLRSVSRDADLAGRLGGEELAIILPETREDGARTVAERVRRQIERARHETLEGDTFRVTTSIGVAVLAPGLETGEALLRRADAALYRAKDGGRNRVITATG